MKKIFENETNGKGELLYSASADGEIKVWDLEKRRSIFSITEAHGDQSHFIKKESASILSLQCCEDGLLSQGRDGQVKLWNFDTMKEGNSISMAPISTISTRFLSFAHFSHIYCNNSLLVSIPAETPN